MIQAGNRSRFPLETFPQFGSIGKVIGQNLDSDDTVEARARYTSPIPPAPMAERIS
jgi:hypothetical protein